MINSIIYIIISWITNFIVIFSIFCSITSTFTFISSSNKIFSKGTIFNTFIRRSNIFYIITSTITIHFTSIIIFILIFFKIFTWRTLYCTISILPIHSFGAIFNTYLSINEILIWTLRYTFIKNIFTTTTISSGINRVRLIIKFISIYTSLITFFHWHRSFLYRVIKGFISFAFIRTNTIFNNKIRTWSYA